ncbi:MAG: endonuclease/exonuclease/phosphatase family protein [Saprospiraceae bacterium]|nr:endonuclease/exonuclease/phosphatase family protein [Saprospiraceae bacterium]
MANRFWTALLIVLFLLPITANSQDISVMTFNLRYSTPRDGENSWDNRKAFVADLLQYYEPDIFGVQEALDEQMQYLDQVLTAYTFVGVARDDGKKKGEYSGVFYQKDQYQLLEGSTFWLSEQPNKPSVGWDASMERICTYVHLKHNSSGRQFWVFNTHFDHKGKQARAKSVDLILQWIQKKNKAGEPVFLTGDLNLSPEEKPIKKLAKAMADSWEHSLNPPYGPTGTFNGFKFDSLLERRIDYIFVSRENIEVKKYITIDDFKEFRYPSDHMPVLIHCKIEP